MLILGIICLMNACLFYYYARRILYPGVVFNAMWGAIFILNKLNFYELYDVHYLAVFLISVGILAFNLICMFQRNIGVHFCLGKIRLLNQCPKKVNYALIAVWLNRINFFVLLLLLIPLFRLLPAMKVYGGYTMRRIYTTGFYPDGSVFMSAIERLLYIHFGIMPASEALFAFSCVLWLCGKININNIIYPTFSMIISGLISGGRMAFFYCLVILGATYLMSAKDFLSKCSRKKIRRIIILLMALSVLYMLYNTLSRTRGRNATLSDSLRAIDLYFTCGVHLFDHALKNPESYGLTHMTFGLTSFAGLLSFLYYGSYFLTGGRFTIGVTSNFAQDYLASSVFLGDSAYLNAFPTMFYYPYRDLGILGIIIAGCVLALIGINLYSSAKNKKNIISLIFFAEYVYFTIFSVCWLDTYRSEFWAKLIWLILLKKFLIDWVGRKTHK